MGVATQTEKPPDQPFLELEAPEFLEKGQNFFDQPPFANIIQKTSEITAISIENLRSYLKSCAQIGTVGGGINMASQELSQKMKNGKYDYYMKHVGPKEPGKNQQYIKAMEILGSQLEGFPDWHEYIVTQCAQTSHYRANGTYAQTAKEHIPVESYAKWASRRQATDQKAKLLGLGEVLPQGFQEEIHLQQPLQTDKSIQSRIWRILKADNLKVKIAPKVG